MHCSVSGVGALSVARLGHGFIDVFSVGSWSGRVAICVAGNRCWIVYSVNKEILQY